MDIKPLRTEAEYEAALKEAEALMSAGPDTPEGERLVQLATLVEAYEAEHYRIDPPDLVAAIEFEIERRGLTVEGMEKILGKESRLRDILNHTFHPPRDMVKRISQKLDLPEDYLGELIQPQPQPQPQSQPGVQPQPHIQPHHQSRPQPQTPAPRP